MKEYMDVNDVTVLHISFSFVIKLKKFSCCGSVFASCKSFLFIQNDVTSFSLLVISCNCNCNDLTCCSNLS